MTRTPALAAFLLTACVATPLFAAETATVIGRVTDASGAALPGATVAARNVDTGISRSVVSEPTGAYRVPVLPPGAYEFTAELAGFGSARRRGVRLTIGSEVTLDFELKVASVTEEVTVTADAPLVETTNAAVYTLVTREEIDILPIIGRDFLSLVKLAPGVQNTAQGSDIGGARGRSNSYLVDGVDNGGEITGNRLQQTNLDSIQEFQVLTNSFKAEYGRAGGGVISVLTRSGRNNFDGGLFFLYRDQDMVARNPFLTPGDPKDPFERKQYGGFLGGPIRKDRTHFFVSFDYENRETASTRTLPLPAPGAAVSDATAQFLRQNDITLPFEGGTRRFVRPEFIRYPRLTARFDHAASQRHNFTLNLHWERENSPSGKAGTIYDTQGGVDVSKEVSAQLNYKWIRSSTHLNELYFKIGRTSFDGKRDFPDLINISIDEADGIYLGGNTDRPQGRTDDYFQLVDNYTIHKPGAWKGSHVLKFGFDSKVFRSDSFFDSNFRGTYFFTTVANFLAGRPRRFTVREGDSTLDRPITALGLYVQDDWTISPRLTFNLGLRWDYERGTVEALKDIPPGSPVCAFTDRCGKSGTANSDDYNNVAPRLGFVWDPRGDGKTAVHGGAGLYYDQVILNIQGNARFTAPKIVAIQIENPTFPDPFQGGTRTTLRPDVQVVDENLVTPYSVRTSLGLKRQLSTNTSGDVTFSWNRGYDQVLRPNINTINPAPRLRPNADFTNVTLYTNEGEFKYRAMTLELRRRMAGRFQGGLAYTLSKTENNGETFLSGYQFPRAPQRNSGPGDEDRRHVLVGHAVAKLPWDFDLAAVVDFRSERPLDVFAGGVDIDGDGITGDYPNGYSRNQVRELGLEEANRLRAEFNRAPIAEYQDNPKFFNTDVTLQKRFKVGGERALRFTLEVFNVFNHPNYFRPSGSITSAFFGRRTSIDVTRDARPRSFQVTGQIDF